MVQNNSLNNVSPTFNPSALTVNSVYTFPTSDGTAGQVLETDGAGAVTWEADTSVEYLIQTASANTTSRITCATLFPLDDTIPQNTEGDEVITVSITPTNSTNVLVIQFISNFALATATATGLVALFQDSTANALSAAYGATVFNTNYNAPFVLTHIMDAGTTSSTTFKIRAGSHNDAKTVYVNGTSTTRFFGGTAQARITVFEYKAGA